MKVYDRIILGAGLYGLYSALFSAKKQPKEKILVLEYDDSPFQRATFVNQARVHMGYHYPRSLSTALKSAHYFERFLEEYPFCIHQQFDKIYATSHRFSWTNAHQFQRFSQASNIPCEAVMPSLYFKEQLCDGAFLTREFTYDAQALREHFLQELAKIPQVELCFGAKLTDVAQESSHFALTLADGRKVSSDFVLNATYASVNQILDRLSYPMLDIKYELCEIILCNVNKKLKNVGITVMDGPFFSIMPFGQTGLHSLTSVTFTPHDTCYEKKPRFSCQEGLAGFCSENQLGNCNFCPNKPETAWPYMSNLAKKYLLDSYEFSYERSLFSMKPILLRSEIDDSRPTVILENSRSPRFITVLSGKINTVFDLEEVLCHVGT